MFSEHLKSDRSARVFFERLGAESTLSPLTPEELEECTGMGRVQGAKYALYLSCGDLKKEGTELFEKGEIFSPLDITEALSLPDILACYEIIKEISGFGEARVSFIKEGGESLLEQTEPGKERKTEAFSKTGFYEAESGAAEHLEIEERYGQTGSSRPAGKSYRQGKSFAGLDLEGFVKNLMRAAGNM